MEPNLNSSQENTPKSLQDLQKFSMEILKTELKTPDGFENFSVGKIQEWINEKWQWLENLQSIKKREKQPENTVERAPVVDIGETPLGNPVHPKTPMTDAVSVNPPHKEIDLEIGKGTAISEENKEPASEKLRPTDEAGPEGKKPTSEKLPEIKQEQPPVPEAEKIPEAQTLEPFDIGGQKFDRLQHVNVKRSSGEIEDDWFIVGVNADGGSVQLAKDIKLENGKGEVPGKKVKIEDFLAWNNLGPEIEKPEPIPESQPITPVPETTPTTPEENIPEWKKMEEWKEFEKLRKGRAEAEIEFTKMAGIGKVLTDAVTFKLGKNVRDYRESREFKESAKNEYDEQKNVLAQKIKETLRAEMGIGPLTKEQETGLNSKINDVLFEELVKNENDAYINALREARGETTLGKTIEHAKSILSTKAMKWYLGLSRTQRMAISFGIGSAAGLLAGATVAPGAIGVASYLAWRAARVGLSGTAGAVAGEWANKRWSAEELKKAEEKETEDLKKEPNISLEEKSKGFSDIQQRYKKERLKMTLKKMGTTITAGAGTGLLTGLAEHVVMGMGSAAKSAAEVGSGKGGGGANSLADNRMPRGAIRTTPSEPQTILSPRASIPPEATAPKTSVIPESTPKVAPVEAKVAAAAVTKSATETVQPISYVENLDFIHQVKAGDSTWKILGETLEKNDQFKGMTEAQKTYVLSTLTNKALQHPENYGLGREGVIHIGDKTDFTKLFEDTKGVKSILDKAKDTITPGSAQEHSILTNNAKIADWVDRNPNVKLTNDKVAEILNTKPKITETVLVPEPKPEIIKGLKNLGAEPTHPNPLDHVHSLNPNEGVNDHTIIKGLGTEPAETLAKPPEPLPNNVLQKNLQDEIAEAKQRLQTLEENRPRTMASDVYANHSVEEAFKSGIDKVYEKHNFLGFGTVAGSNTGEWRFMTKLPADKLIEHYTVNSSNSSLTADIVEKLSKSPKHNAFMKEVIGLMEQSNGAVKPFVNEKMGDFMKRLVGYALKVHLSKTT